MAGAIFHCSWQARYLVKFEGGFSCSAQCKSDVSCVATVKHECRPSVVLCMPEVAPRNVLDRVLGLSNGL